MNWFSAFASPLTFEEKEENVLGRGGYGIVYKGTFEGNAVAVKVINKKNLNDKGKQEQKREMEEQPRLDHENVLKLLHVIERKSIFSKFFQFFQFQSWDKTCLVLELCAGTLTDYCEGRYKGPELPPDRAVLYQIANGLQYIHSQNLVHRDVKPDNILISLTTPVQIKLSDFGLVKKTSFQGTFTQHSQLIGLKGAHCWLAPETFKFFFEFSKKVQKLSPDTPSEEIPHGTIQSDTFSAGLVFFFFLTRGTHPFGIIVKVNDYYKISGNIEDNNPIEFNEHIKNLKEGDDRALYELIGEMIKPIGQRIELPEVIEQLTTNLRSALRQFKRVARLVREGNEIFGSRFHPKKLLIACGITNEIIFFSAENWSIPFSNWREEENKFQIGHITKITTMEWNVDGTQLVAVSHEGDVIVWSYPSGEILFQKKISKYKPLARIDWNPFRPNVFATFGGNIYGDVSFCNSCPVDQRPFHFYTINYNEAISSFQWISETRIALGLREYGREDGRIEIWEIDESTNSAKYVKRFQHEDGSIVDLVWNERTKCLAACSWDGWVMIWSMDRDQPIHATKVDDGCRSLAWRSNGKQSDDEGVDAARKSANNFILVGGLVNGKIVIWTPLAEAKTRILISQHSCAVESLSFSPDGRFLASTDEGKKLIIWSAEDWEPVYEGVGWGERHSWLSSSTDVPDYKLTFNPFQHGKVEVVESAAVV